MCWGNRLTNSCFHDTCRCHSAILQCRSAIPSIVILESPPYNSIHCINRVGESPRWLLRQAKWQEAEREIQRMAKINGSDAPADLLNTTEVLCDALEVLKLLNKVYFSNTIYKRSIQHNHPTSSSYATLTESLQFKFLRTKRSSWRKHHMKVGNTSWHWSEGPIWDALRWISGTPGR